MEHRFRAAAPASPLADEDVDADGEEVPEADDVAVDEGADEDADGDAEVEDEEDDEAEIDSGEEEDDEEEVQILRVNTRSTRSTRSDRARTRTQTDAKTSSDESQDEEEANEGSSDDENEEDDVAGEISADETNESIQVATRNNCVFCGQDEDHDPSPEFEETLACAACGDNAHRQCAREAKTLGHYAHAATTWRCPSCVENNLQPDSSITEPDSTEKARSRRRSSTSRFTRDLLPASRGISRPGSHSVFNTLILDDDPLDGSRSLRKRKATSEQPEVPQKRARTSTIRTNGSATTPERILADKIDRLNAQSSEPPSLEATNTRPSRTPRRRHSVVHTATVKVLKKTSESLVLSLPVPPSKLGALAQRKKKRDRPRQTMASVPERPGQSSQYATPFYAFHERENDDLKSKPYGGILSEKDAETTLTLPLQADRLRFNKAREKAEEERKERAALSEAEQEAKGRSQKIAGPPSKIKAVYFGGYEIETWYAAPYPEEYSRNRVLYLCEHCLKYMSSDFVAWRHKSKCAARHPPGDEIYRDGSISIFEVDGRKNPVYCQNLCLLAKLFLGSKTLYYDVEPFLFYVMTEADEHGCHFVGYFSKEKRPNSFNNVSCILTLPTHQRKGYGNLLISFSYLLTRVEGKTGSPEKPLSDMGLVSYRNYWRLTLSYELRNQVDPISIPELSDRTGMTADDIIAALEGLRALVRDPVTKVYALRLDYDYFDKCISDWEAKKYVTINPDALVWTPYIMGRSNLAHYETAPPLPTVAPREDEEDENGVAAEEGVQAATQHTASSLALDSSAKALENESAILDDPPEQQPNGTHAQSDEALLASQLHATPTPSAIPPSFPDNTISQANTNPPNSANDLTTPHPSPTKQHPPQPSPLDIPPTRFEVWPPIPGTQARPKSKKGGWRPGAGNKRKTPGTGTATRSSTAAAALALNGTSDGNGEETHHITRSGMATRSSTPSHVLGREKGRDGTPSRYSPLPGSNMPVTRRSALSISNSQSSARREGVNDGTSRNGAGGGSDGVGGATTPVRVDTNSSGGSGGSVRRSTRSSRRLEGLVGHTEIGFGDKEVVVGIEDVEGEDDERYEGQVDAGDEDAEGDVDEDFEGGAEGGQDVDRDGEGDEDAGGDADAEGDSE